MLRQLAASAMLLLASIFLYCQTWRFLAFAGIAPILLIISWLGYRGGWCLWSALLLNVLWYFWGKNWKWSIPSSIWAAKILLHNPVRLRLFCWSKLTHCFLILLPLSASLLSFISSIWTADALGQELLFQCLCEALCWVGPVRNLDRNQAFTPPIHDYHVVSHPKLRLLQWPCVPSWEVLCILVF